MTFSDCSLPQSVLKYACYRHGIQAGHALKTKEKRDGRDRLQIDGQNEKYEEDKA